MPNSRRPLRSRRWDRRSSGIVESRAVSPPGAGARLGGAPRSRLRLEQAVRACERDRPRAAFAIRVDPERRAERWPRRNCLAVRSRAGSIERGHRPFGRFQLGRTHRPTMGRWGLGDRARVHARDRVAMRGQAPQVVGEEAAPAAMQDSPCNASSSGSTEATDARRQGEDQRAGLRHPAAAIGLRQVVEADRAHRHVGDAVLGLDAVGVLAQMQDEASWPSRRIWDRDGQAPGGQRS